MGLIAKDTGGGGDFGILDAGTHLAVCTQVIDLGTTLKQFAGYEPKKLHEVIVTWETPEERIDIPDADGKTESKPRWISKTYTLSLFKKSNLCIDLTNWRGRQFTEKERDGFDVKNILGKSCMISVSHKTSGEKTYANVTGVAGLMKGLNPVEPEGNVNYFSIEEGGPIPEHLPDWMKERIMESDEWKARDVGVHPTDKDDYIADEDDDSPPF